MNLNEIKLEYYLGYYQTCINKANSAPASRESTFYMCLSYCQLRKFDILELELSKCKEKFVEVLKLFVADLKAPEERRKPNGPIINKLNRLFDDQIIAKDDELSRLVASSLYVHRELYTKALEVIDKQSSSPIRLAKVQILLLMNRMDLAATQLSEIMKIDSESVYANLAQYNYDLASNNPVGAFEIAHALSADRPSPMLCNLMAVAKICLGEYAEAKQYCEAALDADNDNTEALINMAHILSKTDAAQDVRQRNLDRLRAVSPHHDFLANLDRLQTELAAFS